MGLYVRLRVYVAGVIVIDRSRLDQAEPYGDCLTHGAGHYDRWQERQRRGLRWLSAQGYQSVILTTEYDA
jgi:hypothetical protein